MQRGSNNLISNDDGKIGYVSEISHYKTSDNKYLNEFSQAQELVSE